MVMVVIDTASHCCVIDERAAYAVKRTALHDWVLKHFEYCIAEPDLVPRTYDALKEWLDSELGVDVIPLVVE